MKIFYTYVYTDIKKRGKFSYGKYEFDSEPFYVGKGCGNRYDIKLHSKASIQTYTAKKIRHMMSEGNSPNIIKYKECITEKEAFDLEIDLIKTIGRLDLGTGPLCNHTDGGEGHKGRKMSEETKEKIRNAHIGLKHSAETKAKISFINKNRAPASEETRMKISAANKGKTRSEEAKNKTRIGSIGKKRTEEQKKRISEGIKNSPNFADKGKRISEGILNSQSAINSRKINGSNRKGKPTSEMHRINTSIGTKKWWDERKLKFNI